MGYRKRNIFEWFNIFPPKQYCMCIYEQLAWDFVNNNRIGRVQRNRGNDFFDKFKFQDKSITRNTINVTLYLFMLGK